MHLIIIGLPAAGAVCIEKIASSGPSAAMFTALTIIQPNCERKVNQQNDGHGSLISGWNKETANGDGYDGGNDGYNLCGGSAHMSLLHRQRRNDGLAIPVQQDGEATGIAGGVEQVVDTGFLVYPDLVGAKGTVGPDFYKTLIVGQINHPLFWKSIGSYGTGKQYRSALHRCSEG